MSDLENMTLLELRNFAKEKNIRNICHHTFNFRFKALQFTFDEFDLYVAYVFINILF